MPNDGTQPGQDGHVSQDGSIAEGKKGPGCIKTGLYVLGGIAAVGAATWYVINQLSDDDSDEPDDIRDRVERILNRDTRAPGTSRNEPAPPAMNQATGRPVVDMENVGLGSWENAQEQRESTGAVPAAKNDLGWDTYYDPIETPFNQNLGDDEFRFMARMKAMATTDMASLEEAIKLEWEPIGKMGEDFRLRLVLLGQNINGTYENGSYPDLTVDEQRLTTFLETYFDLGRHEFKIGLGGRLVRWSSEGGNAPDRISANLAGGEICWNDTETGVSVMLRKLYDKGGEYDFLGTTSAADFDDFMAAVKWNVPGRKNFVGAEYQQTSSDFEGAQSTTDKRFTLYGGTRNAKWADEFAAAMTYVGRENSIGDDYGRFGAEARATWHLGKKGWLRASVLARDATPENKDVGNNVEVGVGVSSGVTF